MQNRKCTDPGLPAARALTKSPSRRKWRGTEGKSGIPALPPPLRKSQPTKNQDRRWARGPATWRTSTGRATKKTTRRTPSSLVTSAHQWRHNIPTCRKGASSWNSACGAASRDRSRGRGAWLWVRTTASSWPTRPTTECKCWTPGGGCRRRSGRTATARANSTV